MLWCIIPAHECTLVVVDIIHHLSFAKNEFPRPNDKGTDEREKTTTTTATKCSGWIVFAGKVDNNQTLREKKRISFFFNPSKFLLGMITWVRSRVLRKTRAVFFLLSFRYIQWTEQDRYLSIFRRTKRYCVSIVCDDQRQIEIEHGIHDKDGCSGQKFLSLCFAWYKIVHICTWLVASLSRWSAPFVNGQTWNKTLSNWIAAKERYGERLCSWVCAMLRAEQELWIVEHWPNICNQFRKHS